jgi:hypothetical protein
MEGLRYRAVFHLDEDDEERAHLTLANMRNVCEELDAVNVELMLVINGTALRQFQESSVHSELLEDLKAKNVLFRACRRSLKRCEMSESDLIEHFTFVGSGVAELVKRQNEGWGYIKP